MVVKIGILASCASRDGFRSYYNENYKEYFEVVFNLPRISTISLMDTPIEYNENELIIEPNNAANEFRTNILKNDLSKQFLKNLTDKQIDYLIIDEFFEVIFGIIKINDHIFTNNFWDYPSTQFYNNLNNINIITPENDFENYFRLWADACDKFFSFMKTHFSKIKIILNKIRLTYVILKNNTYYVDELSKIKAKKYNPIIEKFENYLIEHYDVIVVDCLSNITGDENHIWGKGVVHYNKEYYNKFFKKMLEITKE